MYFNTKEIGARIQKLRQEKHLTQEQLAEQLHISENHMGRLEAGMRGCSIDLLIDLAAFFDVSTDYLILGREYRNQPAREAVAEIIHALEALQEILLRQFTYLCLRGRVLWIKPRKTRPARP